MAAIIVHPCLFLFFDIVFFAKVLGEEEALSRARLALDYVGFIEYIMQQSSAEFILLLQDDAFAGAPYVHC